MTVDSTTRIGLSREDLFSFSRAIPRARSAPLAVGVIVALSTVVRAFGALKHPAPTLFPDEYIYTALARSFGSSGLPLIRGAVAHFPAVLAPIAAAPIWALAPAQLAYHLVQVENALFMSLAAIPAYLLARAAGLGTRYSLVCSVFVVAGPGLAFSARTIADPLGYPLALGALYLALVALTRPSRWTQLAFFAVASLAVFARVQYVVLFAAYLGAVAVTRRREALQTHRLTLGVAVGGLLAVVAAGPTRLLGYYSAVLHLHLGLDTLHWIGTDLFLIALGSGVVLVPGAVVGLAGMRTRAEASFTVLILLYAAAILFEAGLYASNGSDRFQGRYLLSLSPLIPIAFGLYMRNGRRMRGVVWVIAALIFILAARVPVSGYAISTGSTDSPFLWAVVRLQALLGLGSASLFVAVYAGAAALLAVLVAYGLRARVAVACALVFLGVTSVAGTAADIRAARLTRAEYVSLHPTWVDDARVGDVTAIATNRASSGLLTEQLFWNRTITREVLLDGAEPTDAFAAADVRIASDGTLETPAGPIRTAILFERYGTTATFQDARLVASTPSFALWQPRATARLAMLQSGRYQDGWLATGGYLAFWPKAGKRLRGTVSFTVSLPAAFKATELTFGDRTTRLRPGTSTRLSYCVDTAREWKVLFHGGGAFLPDFRRVSVRETAPRFTRGTSCGSTGKS
jgi:hypothetical protein